MIDQISGGGLPTVIHVGAVPLVRDMYLYHAEKNHCMFFLDKALYIY